MSPEQAARLGELMREHKGTRPAAVLNASLLYEGGVGRLIAVWRSRDDLDRYLSTAAVPRGTELMRQVGVEPELRIVKALACG